MKDGRLMLSALLKDLAKSGRWRVSTLVSPSMGVNGLSADKVIEVKNDFFTAADVEIQRADAVWIIAPECGETLLRLSAIVLNAGKYLIGCRPDALELCGDKLRLWKVLGGKIAMPRTKAYTTATISREKFPCVVKPMDGAGGEEVFYVENRREFEQLDRQNRNCISQPYLSGENLSAGILTAGGRNTLLGVCRQNVKIGRKIMPDGINGPIKYKQRGKIEKMIDEITKMIPGLRGYWGMDFIDHNGEPVLLEINPRLTASYPVYSNSCGFNIASAVVLDACKPTTLA